MSPVTESDLLRQVEASRARTTALETRSHQVLLAAEALGESTDTFRRIFDQSNDAIFVIDPESDRIVNANPMASVMLGYSPSELMGMRASEIHSHETTRLREFVHSVTREGQGWTAELSCRNKAGHLVPTEISASLLRQGSVRHVIAMVRDISDRKRAEVALHKANELLHADVEAAAQAQRALLPIHPLGIEGLECAWRVRPCERLGGDTLNVVPLPKRKTGLYLIDVSGHGVKAAMLSVALHRALSPSPSATSVLVQDSESEGTHALPPSAVASIMNGLFPLEDTTRQFFTMFYGVYDPAHRLLTFVSAGQGAPVLLPRQGGVREIDARGFPIGVIAGAAFDEHVVPLEPGDRLYVWSDGMEDALDREGEPLGRTRLIAEVENTRYGGLSGSVDALFARMERWAAGADAIDDASLLAIEVVQPPR